MANYIKGTKIQENSISETKLDSSLQSWKETVTNHINNNDNPHNITKSSIGLDNVTNDAQVKRSELGVANGVATLDSTGKVPSGQLPSYVDDVIEGYLYNGVFYKDTSYTTSIVGESGKIYIDLPTNKTYRWTGSVYGVISETIALGETSSTAYRGDRGKIAYDHSQSAHAPSNAQANVIETIKVNGTALTPNSKAVDITIPTVGNGTITIKQGGTSKGTFTTNQNGNTTIELTDTNTTYTAGDGLSLSGTTFSNNGVRSIATGTTNGTISVNTNGNISNIEVYGLKSAAYTNSSDYAAASHTHTFASLTDKPTTISGYGITDAYTASTIDSKLNGYLPLSGGTISGSGAELLKLDSSNSSYNAILFKIGGVAKSEFGFTVDNCSYIYDYTSNKYIGIDVSGTPFYGAMNGDSKYTLIHSGNYNSYALPLSGGMITSETMAPLQLKSTSSSGHSILQFISGETYLGALGFKGKNDPYFRTAEGAFNTLIHSGNYNSYAPTLTGTGASGTWGINISGNAETATNADTLDGIHYKNILERRSSGASSSSTATGWFRIAATSEVDSKGTSFLLAIQRNYNHVNNESYLFAISVNYNGKISITQLSGCYNIQLISKIRIDWKRDNVAYIDLYIEHSSTNNEYHWYTVGAANSYTAWTVNPTLNGTAYEFTTVNGCKSDFGFTGNIAGNATSATQLQTPRTIWGRGFDGTDNVSGALTEVTTITTSGQICINTSSSQRNNYNEGIRCNLGGSDNWASVVLGGASGSTNGAGSGVYSLLVNSSLFRIRQNSTEVLCINTSNNVGIGTTSPSYKLDVAGVIRASNSLRSQFIELSASTPFIDFHYDNSTADYTSRIIEGLSGQLTVTGKLRVGLSATTSTDYAFHVVGDGYFTENVITESNFSSRGNAIIDGTVSCTQLLQTSDIKYKTNIKQIEYEEALKIIENLNPVTWDWNENTKISGSSSGFIAQEVKDIIPNAVSEGDENTLSLDYTQLHSYEIKVIQEQQKEIKDLKQRLEVLESLVLQLTNREI